MATNQKSSIHKRERVMAFTSRIANELLVTPFDNKCAVSNEITEKLTNSEFCEHCYSAPMFRQKTLKYLNEDFKDTDNDFETNYNDIKNEIHYQEVAYSNFKLWLNNLSDSRVYTINGNAGTGKTTFINYRKYEEKNIKWIILDIHLSRNHDEWFSDIRTVVQHFEQAQSKVYGCIMNKLWEMIFQGLDENGNYSLQRVYDNILSLVINYKNKFINQYPSGRKLLDEICELVETEKSIPQMVELSAETFKKYITGKVENDGDGVINILNIFLLVIRCLSDNIDDTYIIVFDNFERFIAKDELYNKDVDNIRLLLTSYVGRLNQAGSCHRQHFKFAMAVRDSTARMCGVRLQASDSEASNLDLSQWYNTQDIIDCKKKWYKLKNISIVNSELVEQIIGDSRICSNQTITGLKLLIDPLFNDNKRLIIDFIGSMIELPSNQKNIKLYIDLWNEDTSLSRFAARSIIRGMILNELEEKPDNLFEHLKTYSTKNNKNGIGDARKILTILYNNVNRGNENAIPLTSVLSELFHITNIEAVWNSDTYADKRKSISEILFYMNSYNRRENDWIQFIDLQFKENNYTLVIENANKLEQIIGQQMDNCTVHLMPAGRAYLMYIVASFEFFSLRYVKNYSPLFTLIPTPTEIIKYRSVIDLPCYKKIKSVIYYAEKCIRTLIYKEDTIKLYIDKSSIGKYHYTRIINQHKAYINAFATYIKEKYCIKENMNKKITDMYWSLHKEIITLGNSYNTFKNNMDNSLRS